MLRMTVFRYSWMHVETLRRQSNAQEMDVRIRCFHRMYEPSTSGPIKSYCERATSYYRRIIHPKPRHSFRRTRESALATVNLLANWTALSSLHVLEGWYY